MKFGPVPPSSVPAQDPSKVLLLAERWQRASFAQQKWAERAKQAVDFFEGRQWTAEQLQKLKNRPALTFNIIAPVVRLVLGYQRNNKTDITYKPGQDSRSTEEVADALNGVEKAISEMNEQQFVDVEVFMDGLVGGRGWFDTRLDWENNDLGEIKTIADDPFTVYVDPDASAYDVNSTASYICQSKMVSPEEIEGAFGKNIADLVKPFTLGKTPLSPISNIVVNDEITPVRFWGERSEGDVDWWNSFYSSMGDFADTYRKTIRILEIQYKVKEPRNVMIDLETGDKKVLPIEWGPDHIQKALLYAEMVDNPCIIQRRIVERIHWTTIAGDLILYDAPSLYDTYTKTLYAPYFRRGMTRGMVEDLIDPQKQKNKERSNATEIVAKSANGGWKYHESSLDPVQEAALKKYGSTPGFDLKWKGEKEPEQIQPGTPPIAHNQLEVKNDEDIRRISGINEAAMGDVDNKATSGRAIEARQRQAVISVQTYMDNFKRSKRLLGVQHLGIVQNHYTEKRIYRITGADSKESQIVINQMMMDPMSGVKKILNDVTLGKYAIVVDDSPISPSYHEAQFDEMMIVLEKLGPIIGPMLPGFADLIISASSMPRKEEWIERLQAIASGSAALAGGAPPPGGAPPGGPPGGGQKQLAPPQSTQGGLQPPAQGGGNVVPLRA